MLLVCGCVLRACARGDPALPALEQVTLRVGVGNPLETAPARLAAADGSFTLVDERTQQDGLSGLAVGTIDVAFATGITFFSAPTCGTGLQLQGEAYLSAPYTMSLVSLPGLGRLTVDTMVATTGNAPATVRFVTRTYDPLADALRDGSAPAALMIEPYLTKAEQDPGARVLADSCRGATADFPVSA